MVGTYYKLAELKVKKFKEVQALNMRRLRGPDEDFQIYLVIPKSEVIKEESKEEDQKESKEEFRRKLRKKKVLEKITLLRMKKKKWILRYLTENILSKNRKVLWGDLMVMFNPDDENDFWNAQQDWNIVSWKLHGSSGLESEEDSVMALELIREIPELENESYVLYDRVMTPLAAQLERKPRRDHGTRRARHSTSSSSAFDQPSSDDDDDGNDEGTSHASTPSPIRYVNSLTNQVPQVFQNPHNIDPHLEPFYTRQTEIINR
ncbi:hypothetical protein Tco_0435673 [Tanacetum coccineum]